MFVSAARNVWGSCWGSVAVVVGRGGLGWFGRVERGCGDDWVLACGGVVVVAVVGCVGRSGAHEETM